MNKEVAMMWRRRYMKPMTVRVGHGGGHWEIHRGDKIVADFVSDEANAMLFAAAEDLLAACRMLLHEYEHGHGNGYHHPAGAAWAAIRRAERGDHVCDPVVAAIPGGDPSLTMKKGE